jgi:hypothetical protein
MKKLVFTAFALFALLQVQAQTETEEENGDTTKLHFGKTQVWVMEGEEEESDTIDASPEDDSPSHDGHWAGVDFGVTMLMNSDMKSSFPGNPQWENDPAKSFYWNLNLFDHRFNIYKEYIGITTGLGFGFTQIGLQNNYLLNENTDSIWVVTDTINDYSKNKLRASYLQVPLLLEFNTSSDEDHSFYFAAGVVGGVRIGSSVKRKSDTENFERKEKIKGTYGINAFKLDGLVRMGYNDWGLFASYSLIPLFDTDKTAEVYPLTFGLSYNF